MFKKFINELVFIYQFESSQIYEHYSQHGNTAKEQEIAQDDTAPVSYLLLWIT